MGYLVRAVVEHIKVKSELPHAEAVKLVDGDYGRGYIMYLVAAHDSTCDATKTVTKHKKSQMRIFDSKDGMNFWTTDIAREIKPLCGFPWDDTLIHVNEVGLDRA